MADAKVTGLDALATVADADILYVVDDAGGTPTSKKITRLDLLTSAAIAGTVEATELTDGTVSITLGDISGVGEIEATTITDGTATLTTGALSGVTNYAGGAVFNDAGADVDFRVEGDTNTSAFVVDAGTDSVGLLGSPLAVAGALDWVPGNTIYVPIGGVIADYITAATAGDTLQLAAGTYTLTTGLTVNKKLHIRGMGRGITKITTSTDLGTTAMLAGTSDGTLFSDMDIEWTSAITGGASKMVDVGANLNFYNVHIYNLATGASSVYPAGFRFAAAKTLNIVNSFYTASGSKGWGALLLNGTSSVVNLHNVHATAADGSAAVGANIVYSDNAGSVINIYGGSYITATDKASAAVECNAGAINVYNGATISGSGATAFDVKRVAGTLTLYAGTNLVNNKTSGTITYAGTVAGSQINLGGTSLNKTQLDALLALLEA